MCLAGSGSGKDNARLINKAVLFKAGLNGLEGNEDLASDAGLALREDNAMPANNRLLVWSRR